MPVAFAALWVVPHLPEFYQAHPEIEIILSGSDRRKDMLPDNPSPRAGYPCSIPTAISRTKSASFLNGWRNCSSFCAEPTFSYRSLASRLNPLPKQ